MNPSVRLAALTRTTDWLKTNSAVLKKVYIAVAAVLTIAYLLLSLLPDPNPAVLKTYSLTTTTYFWIITPVVTLLALIWIAGYYGSLNIKDYSWLIRRSSDGQEINTVSNGLLVLSLSLPVGAVFAGIAGLIERHHTGLVPTFTILTNYLNLVLMGISFALIAKGAENLYASVRPKIRPVPQKYWVLLFIIFSAIYGYFIIAQPLHHPQARKVYFLPDWLMLATIAIPYLYIWYRGLNAAYCLFEYQRNVAGRLYKKALNLLAAGIAMVIISSIATRTISTLSTQLSELSLTPLLFIIYALLALIGIGFILIVAGSRRLRQMEEV
jgi:hypothetical protein